MIRLVDDIGREVRLQAPATRVVSLVPSLTESICVLGARERLVAVTRHCTRPAAGLEQVARVGGTKNPDVAAIVALRPDLVIVNAEENRREDFDALVDGGLTILVTHPRRVTEVPAMLRVVGQAVGADAAAAEQAAALEAELAAQAPAPAGRRVFCPIWKNPWMTFNHETFADDLLHLVGGVNVFRERRERYFEISLDEVEPLGPEVILLPDEPYIFGRKELPALAVLGRTPALRDERVHLVDGKALFWFGTRTAAALSYLRATIAG